MENRKSIFAIANKEKYLTEAPTHLDFVQV